MKAPCGRRASEPAATPGSCRTRPAGIMRAGAPSGRRSRLSVPAWPPPVPAWPPPVPAWPPPVPAWPAARPGTSPGRALAARPARLARTSLPACNTSCTRSGPALDEAGRRRSGHPSRRGRALRDRDRYSANLSGMSVTSWANSRRSRPRGGWRRRRIPAGRQWRTGPRLARSAARGRTWISGSGSRPGRSEAAG
jgi:hypothetical protein